MFAAMTSGGISGNDIKEHDIKAMTSRGGDHLVQNILLPRSSSAQPVVTWLGFHPSDEFPCALGSHGGWGWRGQQRSYQYYYSHW
jgi:hypothetical protein